MRINLPKFRLSNKAKMLVSAGVIVAGTSGVAAFNMLQPATADVMTPTDVKVQEHETRLDKNEQDIAATQERVTQVEGKTDEAAQAVRVVENRVTVVEQGAAAAPRSAEPVAAPAPNPVNPRLVFAVLKQEIKDKDGNFALWQCNYSLESGKVITVNQGSACHEAGTEISADIAAMHGIK